MGDYDQQLIELKQKAERAAKLRELLELMRRQRSSLSYTVSRAKTKQEEEQADVDHMKSGLSGFLSKLAGDYDLRMDKEVFECLEASMELEQAQRELEELKAQQAAYQQELDELLPFEEAYHTRIRTLYEDLRASGTSDGTRAIVLEERLKTVESALTRLAKAKIECTNLEEKAGRSAHSMLQMQTTYEQQSLLLAIRGKNYHRRQQRREDLLEAFRGDRQNEELAIQVPLNHLYKELEDLQVEGAEILQLQISSGNMTEARARLSLALTKIEDRISALTREKQSLREELDRIIEGVAQNAIGQSMQQ